MDWSAIPKQTVFRDDETKTAGDCWRCCVAAVIGRPALEIPHFLQECRANGEHDLDLATQKWLMTRGYMLINARAFFFPGSWCLDDLRAPVIACGPTRRSKQMGDHHAVIFVGSQMVYDPHPDNFGLLAVTDNYMVVPQGR